MEGLVFVFGLRSDFLSLNMIWFFFRIGYFSFCSRFDFLKQFCCHVSIKKEEQIKKFTCTTFHLTNQSSEPPGPAQWYKPLMRRSKASGEKKGP